MTARACEDVNGHNVGLGVAVLSSLGRGDLDAPRHWYSLSLAYLLPYASAEGNPKRPVKSKHLQGRPLIIKCEPFRTSPACHCSDRIKKVTSDLPTSCVRM